MLNLFTDDWKVDIASDNDYDLEEVDKTEAELFKICTQHLTSLMKREFAADQNSVRCWAHYDAFSHYRKLWHSKLAGYSWGVYEGQANPIEKLQKLEELVTDSPENTRKGGPGNAAQMRQLLQSRLCSFSTVF